MGKKHEKRVKVSDSLEDLLTEEIQPSPNLKDEAKQKLNTPHTSQDIIQCPSPLSNIKITRKAFEDLILMCKAVNEISRTRWGPDSPKLEVFCYVLSKSEDQSANPGIISDIFIPQHNASETSVDVSEQSIMEVKEYIKTHQKKVLGWAHSHGHFDVYSSEIDEENHRTLLSDTNNYLTIPPFKMKYVYGITVNDQGERFGVILTQYPCGHIQREEDQNFEIYGEDYTPEEKKTRLKEIYHQIDKKVKLEQPQARKTEADLKTELTEEFIDDYIHNLYRAKNMLYEELPNEADQNFPLIQKTLQKYDNLLMDSVEEAFSRISDRLFKMVQQQKESI